MLIFRNAIFTSQPWDQRAGGHARGLMLLSSPKLGAAGRGNHVLKDGRRGVLREEILELLSGRLGAAWRPDPRNPGRLLVALEGRAAGGGGKGRRGERGGRG